MMFADEYALAAEMSETEALELRNLAEANHAQTGHYGRSLSMRSCHYWKLLEHGN